MMKLVTATPNVLYCDTDQILTANTCLILQSRGIRGVWRYFSGLSTTERDVILASGLELYFVNYSRDRGWLPSMSQGDLDANRDLTECKRLGLPKGVHVAFDLEGPGGTAADVIAHVHEHGILIKQGGFLPALYVGEGSKLNSTQLFQLPSVLYWQSGSQLRDGLSGLEPLCGYSVAQGRPSEITLANVVTIDYDFVREDFSGRLPIGVSA